MEESLAVCKTLAKPSANGRRLRGVRGPWSACSPLRWRKRRMATREDISAATDLRSEGPRPSSLVGRPRARRWASQGRKWSPVGLKGRSFEPRGRFVENRRWRGLGTAATAAGRFRQEIEIRGSRCVIHGRCRFLPKTLREIGNWVAHKARGPTPGALQSR